MVFSVGRESFAGWFVLAVVAGAEGGVSASEVREQLERVGVVDVRGDEVGEALRALDRQGLVSTRDGVRFCVTDAGSERVRRVVDDVQGVAPEK